MKDRLIAAFANAILGAWISMCAVIIYWTVKNGVPVVLYLFDHYPWQFIVIGCTALTGFIFGLICQD